MRRIVLSVLAALCLGVLGAGEVSAAGWGAYAEGRLELFRPRILLVYPRGRDVDAREVRIPDGRYEILYYGWDNVYLVINCRRLSGSGPRALRFVYITPHRWHAETPY